MDICSLSRGVIEDEANGHDDAANVNLNFETPTQFELWQIRVGANIFASNIPLSQVTK